ncbi:hypothetical protein GCM10022278_01970 [Allohahella marinimesophila]|uniref:Alginate export protein n=1 Tax=Allohahella marinimesophila TaxID=1054972 RepID=A0ABP7NGN2_9GAMM
MVEGRDQNYNAVRYLHEFSYRHSQRHPGPTEFGVRGTAGSVGSDVLYLDFRYRQDFEFNDGRQAFMLDIQRGEDLDGLYERQIFGFRHQLLEKTEVWLQGDVTADKSTADAYFSVRRYLGNESWLHASWILPDLYFNTKSDSADEFETEPATAFLQWHQPLKGEDEGLGTTLSLNYLPEAVIVSDTGQLRVESESISAALTHDWMLPAWWLTLDIGGERTQRAYRLRQAEGEVTPVGFDRYLWEITLQSTYTPHPNRPSLGLRYLSVREQGYFGRNLDDVGDIDRREPMIFGSLDFQVSERTQLTPELYLSWVDISQRFDSGRNRSRDEDGFIGKLAFPFVYLMSPEDNAVLTISPSILLHEARFGGGNLQVHWPL